MSKWKAIKEILLASNYIVLTDTSSNGSVSPLYAKKFVDKLNAELERQELADYKHLRMLDELATNPTEDTDS